MITHKTDNMKPGFLSCLTDKSGQWSQIMYLQKLVRNEVSKNSNLTCSPSGTIYIFELEVSNLL